MALEGTVSGISTKTSFELSQVHFVETLSFGGFVRILKAFAVYGFDVLLHRNFDGFCGTIAQV